MPRRLALLGAALAFALCAGLPLSRAAATGGRGNRGARERLAREQPGRGAARAVPLRRRGAGVPARARRRPDARGRAGEPRDRVLLRSRHPERTASRPEGPRGVSRRAASELPARAHRAERGTGRRGGSVPPEGARGRSEGPRGERHARPGLPADAALRRRGRSLPDRARGRALQRQRGLQPGRGAQSRRQARGGRAGDGPLPDAARQPVQDRAQLELPRAGALRGGDGLDRRGAGSRRRPHACGVVRREARRLRGRGAAVDRCRHGDSPGARAGRRRRGRQARRPHRRAGSPTAEERRLGLLRCDGGGGSRGTGPRRARR